MANYDERLQAIITKYSEASELYTPIVENNFFPEPMRNMATSELNKAKSDFKNELKVFFKDAANKLKEFLHFEEEKENIERSVELLTELGTKVDDDINDIIKNIGPISGYFRVFSKKTIPALEHKEEQRLLEAMKQAKDQLRTQANQLLSLIPELEKYRQVGQINELIQLITENISKIPSLSGNELFVCQTSLRSLSNTASMRLEAIKKVPPRSPNGVNLTEIKSIIDNFSDTDLKQLFGECFTFNMLETETYATIAEYLTAKGTHIEEQISQIINKTIQDSNTILSNFGYALDNTETISLKGAIDTITNCPNLKEKIEKFNTLFSKLKQVNANLTRKGVLTANEHGQLVHNTEGLSLEEQSDLRDYTTFSDELKKNAGSNTTVTNLQYHLDILRKKHGVLNQHQTELQLRINDYTNAQANANAQYFRDALSSTAISQLQKAAEGYRVRTQFAVGRDGVKELEKQLFRKQKFFFWNKTAIKNLINARIVITREIVNSQTIICNTESYQQEFEKRIQQLQNIDEKLFGQERVAPIYSALRQKTSLLVGGTRLALPQQLIDISEDLITGLNQTESQVKR